MLLTMNAQPPEIDFDAIAREQAAGFLQFDASSHARDARRATPG